MTESFSNFLGNSRTFGLNVRVPEKTVEQIGKTATNLASGVFEPLFSYLEENENVFSGDIVHDLNKLRSENFNTELAMNKADVQMNGERPKFDAMF